MRHHPTLVHTPLNGSTIWLQTEMTVALYELLSGSHFPTAPLVRLMTVST